VKRMLAIKSRVLAVVALLSFVLLGGRYSAEQRKMNFLVVGVDSASENTDVISVVRLDSGNNRVSFLQIPRDTYCNIDIYENKINHIYSVARAENKSESEAVLKLKKFIEDELAIRFDGYILLNGDDFLALTDAVGGVDIELDRNLTLKNGEETVLELHKGKNHLDSNAAMIFVRHRAGYLRGDIDRLEMQRIFFKGLFSTLMRNITPASAFRIMSALRECETDISNKTLISLFGNRQVYRGADFEGYVLSR